MQKDGKEYKKVKFEVKKIRFRNEESNYTVLEATWTCYPYSDKPTTELVIVGNFLSILEEDEFEGEGEWIVNPTFGHQFSLITSKRILPQSIKGIKSFLMRFCGKDVGERTANKIVECYNEETVSKIVESADNLSCIPGISSKKLRIHETIAKLNKMEEVSIFVLSNGFGYPVTQKIYDEYGAGAILKIRENPYCLCSSSKLDFQVSDQFAKNLQLPYDNEERIKEGLFFYLRYKANNNGDLFTYKTSIIKEFPTFINIYGSYSDDNTKPISQTMINKALIKLIDEKKIIIEANSENKECVYIKSYYYIENKIVDLLKNIIESPKTPFCTNSEIERFLDIYQMETGFQLASKQIDAVYMSLKNGISILTGGPGTGKTQTINTIIQCIKSVKPHALIHLSAPTGKASKRMTELTRMEAKTIHRLIGLSGFNVDDELDKVEGDFLIVDESSMIDAYVFLKLLESLDDKTRIIFVGDHEQLPSVGPGLILRDLINSTKIPTTRLTEIFRQAKESQIVMNAHKIIQGKKTKDKDGLTFDHSKEDFYFIDSNERIKTQNFIIQSVKNLINNKGFSLNDIQILSPMKKGDLGINNLNMLMQKTFNPPTPKKKEMKLNAYTIFREGDRVIQTRNNYDLEVFNGEVGLVVSIYINNKGDSVMDIDFDNKIVTYDEVASEELLLAYCITIHKSQGSEFPVIIMPIDKSQEFMINRNIVYTAWTRAKRTVVVVGSKAVLDNAIDSKQVTKRNSKIKEKIIEKIAS